MAMGMRVADGRDLEQIFTQRISATLFNPSGFRDASGIDAISRFENMRSGNYAAATGLRVAGGADLNNYCDTLAGTAVAFNASATSGPVPGTAGGLYGSASIAFRNDGYYNLAGTWTGTSLGGAWYSNPFATAGTVMYVYCQATLPTATIGLSNANQWLPLSGAPSFSISRQSPNSGTSTVALTLYFSRASAVGTIIATSTCQLSASGRFKDIGT